ncbi:thiol:disulfide interchange protein [Solemya pervernicosa gill symbiont]|uniref:Thiol:disulfide interchange protein n=1 Tax=Solemya pervernicosa gill symbiont TaxID=642797 RepID=A0A1T2L1Q2_9GAMM|nr:DsbE family thiol:disulfide interchange protein [Solemya pervernicosa gill symbiont]OOZ39038.1 thiol:disulfide interchange protein [Solemya pervernicosa gill symbiont]
MARFLLPLGIFILLVALFAVGLTLDPKKVPSPLINKTAPAFDLPRLKQPEARLSQADLSKGVTLFNVWASWCVACRQEHPFLVELAREGVPIYGLNYKDERADGINWLKRLGDPYIASGFDKKGQVGIDWGVYGVPETFIVDRKGMIRYKHIGPINSTDWEETILPMIKKLEAES